MKKGIFSFLFTSVVGLVGNVALAQRYPSPAPPVLGFGLILFWIIFGLVGLGLFIFWILMLIDCIRRDFDQKTLWLVLLIVSLFVAGLYWIVALIYYFVVKRRNLGRKPGGAPPPQTPPQTPPTETPPPA